MSSQRSLGGSFEVDIYFLWHRKFRGNKGLSLCCLIVNMSCFILECRWQIPCLWLADLLLNQPIRALPWQPDKHANLGSFTHLLTERESLGKHAFPLCQPDFIFILSCLGSQNAFQHFCRSAPLSHPCSSPPFCHFLIVLLSSSLT